MYHNWPDEVIEETIMYEGNPLISKEAVLADFIQQSQLWLQK